MLAAEIPPGEARAFFEHQVLLQHFHFHSISTSTAGASASICFYLLLLVLLFLEIRNLEAELWLWLCCGCAMLRLGPRLQAPGEAQLLAELPRWIDGEARPLRQVPGIRHDLGEGAALRAAELRIEWGKNGRK